MFVVYKTCLKVQKDLFIRCFFLSSIAKVLKCSIKDFFPGEPLE